MQSCLAVRTSEVILWLNFATESRNCNQRVLDLLAVLVGSSSSCSAVLLGWVLLYAFLGGAGPLSLSRCNTNRQLKHEASARPHACRDGHNSGHHVRVRHTMTIAPDSVGVYPL